jgi:SEC-C motif-containing protein
VPSVECPCGTGERYAACCGPLHRGDEAAATAEALMRSRYSAFAVGDVAYLRSSWHASTRPARLEVDPSLRWLGLEVLHAQGGMLDTAGVVEFRARHDRGVLHERSRFVREGGRWLYLDGTSPA